MITEEQRKARIGSIGSSDCAAILGLDKYKSALSLWAEKTGAITPEDISEKLQVKLGNKLEQIVAELFEEQTGLKLRRVNETVVHPKYPFITANLDRKVVGQNKICEIKTCSAYRAKEFENENMPADFIAQTMHQMACDGSDGAILAVLIGNHELRIRPVERDEALIDGIIKKEVAFWQDFVLTGAMPQATKIDDDVLFKLFPEGLDKEIALDDGCDSLMESIKNLEADARNLDGIIAKEKNALKAMLGDATVGVSRGFRATWKNQLTGRLDIKALKDSEPDTYSKYTKEVASRVLRIKSLENSEDGGE